MNGTGVLDLNNILVLEKSCQNIKFKSKMSVKYSKSNKNEFIKTDDPPVPKCRLVMNRMN